MANDQQDICHYFVDLEGIGASGFNDKDDDDQVANIAKIATCWQLGQI